jgi:hypothetical protein
LATVVESGPLASDGWLSFVLYPFFLIWLVPATVIMVRRTGSSHAIIQDTPQGLVDAGQRPAAT